MKSFRVAVLFLLVFQCFTITAIYAQDVAGQFVDGGRLVYHRQPAQQEYRLALSGLKKVNSQWRVSREEKVRGIVERKTVELASDTPFAEAERQLRKTLAGIQGATLVFTCDGLDCGSSSGWANHVFDVKTLYGLDSYQHYTVLRIDEGDETLYAVYYLVQRGSGRIYLQQDLVRVMSNGGEVAAVTESAVKKQLTSRGYWTVSGSRDLAAVLSKVEVDVVESLMSTHRRWHIAVVGHNYEPGTIAEQRARSLLQAEVVEQQLLNAGVSAARLTTYGLGSLAPAGRLGEGGRVELVLVLQAP